MPSVTEAVTRGRLAGVVASVLLLLAGGVQAQTEGGGSTSETEKSPPSGEAESTEGSGGSGEAEASSAEEGKSAGESTSTDGSAGREEELSKLESKPESGVDPDLELAFERAEEHLREGSPEAAAWEIRSIYISDDRFTEAQRDERRLEAREVLLEAGDAMRSNGNTAGAARAYDAAWVLGEKGVMPKYADLLVRWARQEQGSDDEKALYLVRRAQRVDPQNGAAGDLDRDIRRNPFAIPAYVSAGIGIAGLVGALVLKSRLNTLQQRIESRKPKSRSEIDSLLSSYRTNRVMFGISGGLGAVGIGLGSFFFSLDFGDVTPVSPGALPGLPGGE